MQNNTNWKTRIEDNILILEKKLQKKVKECDDLKKQIDILKNLVIEYSSIMNNDETNDVSQSLKTKLTLLRLQKQYGTDIFSPESFKQHPTVPTDKHFYKPSSAENENNQNINISTNNNINDNDDNPDNSANSQPSKIENLANDLATTTQKPPPTPPPQFPITIAQQSKKHQKISLVTSAANMNGTKSHYQFIYEHNHIKQDNHRKYDDLNLTGNLQKFIQYNTPKRSYAVQMAMNPNEKGKAWSLKDKLVKYPNDLTGTQNEANKFEEGEQTAFQRTDVGAVSNFLSQNVHDPVFSKQQINWETLHGKTSLNEHIV